MPYKNIKIAARYGSSGKKCPTLGCRSVETPCRIAYLNNGFVFVCLTTFYPRKSNHCYRDRYVHKIIHQFLHFLYFLHVVLQRGKKCEVIVNQYSLPSCLKKKKINVKLGLEPEGLDGVPRQRNGGHDDVPN